jgi:multidrug efflux system outer membrane protein
VTGRLALLLAATTLTACSLEPRYVRPVPAAPPAWPAGDAYPAANAAVPVAVSYRQIFRDPRLQAIIEQAIANNQDLRIAVANVASARALYRVQRAQILPRIDASGGLNTGDRGGSGTDIGGSGTIGDPTLAGGNGTTTRYDAQIGLTAFEIDLFGRLRSLNNAAFQTYLGTEAGMRAARLTLVAEVASAYLALATDRSLLAIATDTEASALRSVDLTRARLEGGIAPRSELRQAETVLAQARADHAALTTAVAQDRNALELLVGAPVADDALPISIEAVDGLLDELPAGLDSRVLLRRPDIAQSEYELRAANARIGAARAAFFPTISLTAVAGFASTALSSLFNGDAFNWSVAPGASLPIFDGGANRGNLAFARAQQDLALAQYQRAIQTGFREVADALARRGTIDRQLTAQRQLEAAARDNYNLADARYREGVDTFLTSLDAQRTLYGARRSLAAARLVRADNLVALYRALGGDMLMPEGEAPPRP